MRERAIDALLLALTDFGQGSVMANGGQRGSKEIDRGAPLVRTEANGRQPEADLAQRTRRTSNFKTFFDESKPASNLNFKG